MKRITALFLTGLAAALCMAQTTAGGTFRQEGIASWYGGEFEGRPTASGEIFKTAQFTAAHPSLPFGTLLRVTNTYNNKQVVVRVNDRGPFVAGRIIDLSQAAAEKLDMVSTGVALVILESTSLPAGYFSEAASAVSPLSAPALQYLPDTDPVLVPEIGPIVPPAAQTTPSYPAASYQPAATYQPAVPAPAAPLYPSVTYQPAANQPAAAPQTALTQPPVQPTTVYQPAPAIQPSSAAPAQPEQEVVLIPVIPPVQSAASRAVQPEPVKVEPVAVEPPPAAEPAKPMAAIKPAMPQGGTGKLYRVQVGSYKVARNALEAYEKLKGVSLDPAYEKNGDLYRVVLGGIKADDMPRVAEKLASAGFQEALIREEH
jgi:rare lipoprotein A